MPDPDVLLRAVLADPRDDLARLAWADAVGGPRGELVRVQLALAGSPHVPPGHASTQREAELLRQRHEWVGEVAPLVRTPVFGRGFVEYVIVDAPAFPRIAEALFDVAPILDLRFEGAAGHPEIFDVPQLRQVRSIDVSHQPIGDDGARAIAASPHLGALRWLNLHNTGIGPDGLEALAASPNLPALAWLGFSANPVDDPTPYPVEDQGFVVGVRTSPLADALQARHGQRAWLQPPGARNPSFRSF